MSNFTRIPAPKFRMGRYVLNEYELRCLIADVAEGKKPEFVGAKITDSFGDKCIITADGSLSGRMRGLSVASEHALRQMAVKRNRNI